MSDRAVCVVTGDEGRARLMELGENQPGDGEVIVAAVCSAVNPRDGRVSGAVPVVEVFQVASGIDLARSVVEPAGVREVLDDELGSEPAVQAGDEDGRAGRCHGFVPAQRAVANGA
jgi:NADPH:quinone reductase-like Zn-dependent oxidoreductase